jgi:hypothetical protein
MENERAYLERKIRRAFQMLILQRSRNPGVKGWELRRHVGKDFRKILEILSKEISSLGLEVYEVKSPDGSEDSSRFLLRFKEPLTLYEAEMGGMRIDELAVLAASIAFLNAKQGRANRKEVERFLREKFPKWRVEYSLDKFIKKGYIEQSEELLQIGWRTKAEIDERTLLTLVLSGVSEKVPSSQ